MSETFPSNDVVFAPYGVEWGWPGPLILGIFLVVSGVAFTGIPYVTAVVLMLLCVLVALIAAMGTAWRVSSERPPERVEF